jgi:hypothetical protein
MGCKWAQWLKLLNSGVLRAALCRAWPDPAELAASSPLITTFQEPSAAAGALSPMQTFIDFLGRLIAGAIKLVLVLAATVFVVGFLLAALVVVVLVSLWSLVTGRKPAPVVLFTRMREQSKRYTQGVWPGAARGEPPADVVDIQATEVTDVSPRGAKTPVEADFTRR